MENQPIQGKKTFPSHQKLPQKEYTTSIGEKNSQSLFARVVRLKNSSHPILIIGGKQSKDNLGRYLKPGELLELKLNDNEWKIIKRTYFISKTKLENPPFQGWKKIIEHQKNVQETWSQIIKNLPEWSSIQISLEKMEFYFSFFPWKWDTYELEWDWKNAKATAYYNDNKEKGAFFLEFNSEFTGFCRFLFQWENQGKEWSFYSLLYKLEFYEYFLKNSETLEKNLRIQWEGLKNFQIDFQSLDYNVSNRGWLV